VLLSLAYLKAERLNYGEYYGFVLLSLAGMMVMVSGADLLTIYLGTELMSLSLYVMAGLKRTEPRSLEASAKYFVLGAFSSGILLYGISLLYGLAGSTRLSVIASAIAAQGIGNPLLSVALVLLAVGFGFKLAVVPFHMWTPDVYQGAPTSVTAFMAVASKAASFGAFLRVFVEGLGGLSADWSLLFLVICVITLVLGNLVAIVQTNIKRMLAYSSIAHAGYALIGVVVAGQQGGAAGNSGLASVLLYIAIYAFMTLGAFALVGMLRKNGQESDNLEDYAGLAKREPMAALFMLRGRQRRDGMAGRHCGRLRRRVCLLLSPSRDGHVHAGHGPSGGRGASTRNIAGPLRRAGLCGRRSCAPGALPEFSGDARHAGHPAAQIILSTSSGFVRPRLTPRRFNLTGWGRSGRFQLQRHRSTASA
jgi:proton-translocating NADH-quinone oxidoreductase chain N